MVELRLRLVFFPLVALCLFSLLIIFHYNCSGLSLALKPSTSPNFSSPRWKCSSDVSWFPFHLVLIHIEFLDGFIQQISPSGIFKVHRKSVWRTGLRFSSDSYHTRHLQHFLFSFFVATFFSFSFFVFRFFLSRVYRYFLLWNKCYLHLQIIFFRLGMRMCPRENFHFFKFFLR